MLDYDTILNNKSVTSFIKFNNKNPENLSKNMTEIIGIAIKKFSDSMSADEFIGVIEDLNAIKNANIKYIPHDKLNKYCAEFSTIDSNVLNRIFFEMFFHKAINLQVTRKNINTDCTVIYDEKTHRTISIESLKPNLVESNSLINSVVMSDRIISDLQSHCGKDGVLDLLDEQVSYEFYYKMIEKVCDYIKKSSKKIDLREPNLLSNSNRDADRIYIEIINQTTTIQKETGRTNFVIIATPRVTAALSSLGNNNKYNVTPSINQSMWHSGYMCYDTMPVFRDIYSKEEYVQIINVADAPDDRTILLHINDVLATEHTNETLDRIRTSKLSYDLYAKDVEKYSTTIFF